MSTKIFLQKFYGKNKTNKSSGLNVNLSGNRKLLPPSSIEEHVNLYEQYVKEREESNIIRLTVQVNPICTNVLCNNITEIVRNEGSERVEVLNYGKENGNIQSIGSVIKKNEDVSFWNGGLEKNKRELKPNDTLGKDSQKTYQAIRDTQLSRKKIGFIYHCGKDIFNNHLLRSHTFKSICVNNSKALFDAAFNTIEDMMRNGNGVQVQDYRFFPISAPSEYKANEGMTNLHVYEYDDIYSYKDALENRMILKYNGWLGFVNRPKLETFETYKNGDIKPLEISMPILYKNAGDFIDMYPERDLFLFNPLYNSFKNRVEKNWNYCITYPSSSTTEVDFINTNKGLNSLKAVGVDEYTKNDNGAGQFVIYSASMHGLMEGDTVNVYKTYETLNEDGEKEVVNQLVCSNSSVISVVDEYTFVIYNNNESVSQKWIDANDKNAVKNAGLTMDKSGNFATKKDDDKKYYVINGKINADETAQNISYKKVVGGVEVDYYVRIFSKLPNFKFSDTKPTENELYKSGSTLIDDYQSLKEEFENHVSKLAFARNIYGDKESEIVFTDNIDLTGLKDNRRRPITTLYLTIIKNNKGYKQWYGKKGNAINIKDDNIEYSHCFGKVNCGFYQSQEAYQTGGDYITIHRLQNVDGISGLSQSDINKTTEEDRKHKTIDAKGNIVYYTDDEDEIDYYTDKHFYGDLVCYDSLNCNETHIQYVNFRFNTAQRELTDKDTSFKYFKGYYYDEIKSDDYDKGGFYLVGDAEKDKPNPCPSMGSNPKYPVCQRKEGYYYQPHFEIPIHTFGKLNSAYPDFLSIRSFKPTSMVDDASSKDIYVLQTHFLEKGDKVMLYDMDKDTYYTGVVTASISPKEFICDFYDNDGNNVNKEVKITAENKTDFKLFKIDNLEIPNYAEIMRDGSCRLVWRNIIHNGTTSDKTIETYPFTNGALYINKPINLVVKRQDPFDFYDLIGDAEPFDKPGVSIDENKIDTSYNSEEIQC